MSHANDPRNLRRALAAKQNGLKEQKQGISYYWDEKQKLLRFHMLAPTSDLFLDRAQAIAHVELTASAMEKCFGVRPETPIKWV